MLRKDGECIKMVGGFARHVAILDYIIGAAMWTLIGRFGMAIFVSENSDFFLMGPSSR